MTAQIASARWLVRAAAMIAIGLLLAACASRPGTVPPAPDRTPPPPPPPTIADEFITTFWCGPPLDYFDDAAARQIADAGFNLVGATCEGPVTPVLNNRALRIAQRNGLKMLIKDRRVSGATPLEPGWQVNANRAIAAYGNHESLAGFFLVDEPNDPATYPDIAAMRRRIHDQAPEAIGYVNLLPDYLFPGPEDYREYVESYVFETRPALLSYDHYPFLEGSDRPSFFENLMVFRELSAEYEVPFMLIAQLMPHADYRDVGDAELAWQVFHAVAFGARGISYFAYWTPTQVPDNRAYRFRKGIIEGGLPTEHYLRVAKLNRRIRAIADQLAGYQAVDLWDSQAEFGSDRRPSMIARIESGELVVGGFEHPDGSVAALFVNRDYRSPTEIAVNHPTEGPLRVFDATAGTWAPLGATLHIPPGEGRLIQSP